MNRFFVSLAVAALSVCSFAQSTLTEASTSNTSACAPGALHCVAPFTGLSDTASGMFNIAPERVSKADMHALEYPGATTDLYVHFLPWFCMQPGSTATGVGTSCNSHIQVGYNSNDPAVVHAQMNDIQERGFRGPVIDWYGGTADIADATTQLIKQDLEARCSGGGCPMSFGLTVDQGAVNRYGCPYDGGGADQSNCIEQALEYNFDYMNSNYFSSPAYLRVDASVMKRSSAGRPVVFFFFCETCFTNPTPNWSYVWNQLRAHVLKYTSGDPLIWFVFRNSVGFTHVQSDGAFAWENHYGSNDPYGLAYLDNFYDSSLNYRGLQPWGAAWKGFDNADAPWKPDVHVTPQQCGMTWLQTFSEMTHNGDYGASNQLPFLQVVTWNDYEEGTEIESGIDNCLSLSAIYDDTNVSWTLNFSGSGGSEQTVDHYEVFASSDGDSLTKLATVPSGTRSAPLGSLGNVAGQSLFVEAVGKASIVNTMSAAATYRAPAPTLASVTPNSGPPMGGNTVTISGTNFRSGASVTFGTVTATVSSVTPTAITAVAPAGAAGAVKVTVTNTDGQSASLASGYTYTASAPTVASVSPNSGSTAGGNTVTVTGTNFRSGAKVYFGAVAATVSSISATSIAVKAPAGSAGTVAVKVTNSDGQSATLPSAYTYVAPTAPPTFALTISPTSKTVTKGTTASYVVTLTPKNGFKGVVSFSVTGLPGGATKTFTPTSVTTSGSTTMAIATKYSARGTFTLTVKGTSGTLNSTVKATLIVK